MKNPFYFHGSRKPDFRNIENIDYNDYWRARGFKMKSKLLPREAVLFDWIQPNSKVLDLGCGTSRLLYDLKTKKNCDCTGFDTSQVAVNGIKAEGVKAEVANIEEKDFVLTENYDYIIFAEVVEHMRFPEDVFKKVIPHTKQIAITLPNSAFYRYRLGLLFNGRFFTQWYKHPSEHLRYWSHIDFMDWLGAQGLIVEKYKAANGFELKDLWPNMFAHQVCYLAKTNINS